MLLPWLPGRAFAVKGFALGLLLFGLSYVWGLGGINPPSYQVIFTAGLLPSAAKW